MTIIHLQQVNTRIVQWIQKKMQQAHTDKLTIDISGGIDSAVTAALCIQASGTDNTLGVYSACHSSPQSKQRARLLAKCLGMQLVEYDLTSIYDKVVSQCQQEFKRLSLSFPDPDASQYRTIFGSLRSTLRAPIGRFTNRAFMGGLRVGTGNRDEDELVRFYQKGGDGEVDINPIAGLFKSEVWQLAEYLDIPTEIINAIPTPDLWGNGEVHNDEEELSTLTGVPLTYTRPNAPLGSIEWASRENQKNGIITGVNQQCNAQQLQEKFSYNAEQIAIIEAIRKLEQASRHKAEPPPYLYRDNLEKEGLVY